MMNRRHLLLGLGAIALAAPVAAKAAGEPILTLRGAFAKAGPDGSLGLTLAELDALPQTRFSTKTPWHEGAVEFSGVSLKDFFAAAGVSPDQHQMQLIALNDYVVDADAAEMIAGDALLATRLNGQPMSVRDKGPIFVIFPFDSRPELNHQSYYSRCAWQLAEIELAK